MLAIEIKKLHKTYRNAKSETLHGIDLDIPKGQFIGILGPNGAGKTTTISTITGVTSPTEGTVKVMGHDVVSDYRIARSKIGVSPQEFTVDMFQTIDEILDYHAGYFGVVGNKMEERRQMLLEKFDLVSHRGKRFQFLSGGLKRRATLAKALMHNPEVLILDEPTAGVDVETRKVLWKFLREFHQEGKTIILTSHYLEEVQELCERVAIIKDGAIIKDSPMAELTKDNKLEDVYLSLVGNES